MVGAGSGKCLDIAGAPAATVQRTCSGATTQQWQPTRTGNTFSLRSSGGLCLEVSGQSRADGAAIAQAACSGAANQQWDIPSLRAADYELLYQADKNRIAWLAAADTAHPLPVTVDGTRAVCRSSDAAHWLGAVAGGSCAGRRTDGTAVTTTAFETLFQDR
jgi:hypothetical protein